MTQVIVIGGGPAGCAIARRLALGGISVTQLVSATVAGREGLSARTCGLLREEGLVDLVDGLRGPVPRTGEWGDGRSVAGQEWLVDRVRLAAAMRAQCSAAGVELYDDRVESIDGEFGSFRVATRSGAAFVAHCVVDASGRRGPELHGPTLVATGQAFRAPTPWPAATCIHPLAWGWCWIVADGHELWVQFAGRPGDGRPDGWLARATAELPALATVLQGAVASGAPVTRPSHARRSSAPARAGLIRAGDAAVALDPLSGQGVYEALRGARVAVAAVRSLLDGADAALVGRFLAERDDALWDRVALTAAAFYAENSACGSFWSDTAAAYRKLERPVEPVPTAIARRPVLDGERIREHDVLVTAAQPRGVWRVDGVPVVELIQFMQRAGNATPAEAAVELAQPRVAILAAARWLRDTGAWPARATQVIAAGG